MGKIYTKTGDKGGTSLFGGKRVSKTDLRIGAIGEVDELNSLIGVAIANIKDTTGRIKIELINVQKDLLEIGSALAKSSISDLSYLRERTKELEESIDKRAKDLPELKNFILPGGGEIGSMLHFSRSVCRRAERRVVALSKKERVDKSILVYLNRLSDFLFVMARFVNSKEKKKEIIWPS